MRIYKNIVSVARIDAKSLIIDSGEKYHEIPIKIPAKLIISDKIEDKVRMYTAQLSFRTCEEMEHIERQAYLCKTVNGKYYVIGSAERPYPITTVTDNHPDNLADSQLYEVTVNYTSSKKISYIEIQT